MTQEENHLLRHAIGLSPHPWKSGSCENRYSYRNYFAAGGDDVDKWDTLVSQGYAKRCSPTELHDYVVFKVTKRAVIAMGLRNYVKNKDFERFPE